MYNYRFRGESVNGGYYVVNTTKTTDRFGKPGNLAFDTQKYAVHQT